MNEKKIFDYCYFFQKYRICTTVTDTPVIKLADVADVSYLARVVPKRCIFLTLLKHVVIFTILVVFPI